MGYTYEYRSIYGYNQSIGYKGNSEMLAQICTADIYMRSAEVGNLTYISIPSYIRT